MRTAFAPVSRRSACVSSLWIPPVYRIRYLAMNLSRRSSSRTTIPLFLSPSESNRRISFRGAGLPLRFSTGKTATRKGCASLAGYTLAISFLPAQPAIRRTKQRTPRDFFRPDREKRIPCYFPLNSLLRRSSTAFSVTRFIGSPPPPKRRSFMLTPPFVEEAVQTTFPVWASII